MYIYTFAEFVFRVTMTTVSVKDPVQDSDSRQLRKLFLQEQTDLHFLNKAVY